MSELNTSAALRILTSESIVEFITETLGISPTSIYLSGTPLSANNPHGARRDGSLWIYESPLPESASLDEHIAHLVDILDEKGDALSRIRPRVSIVDLFCTFSSEGGQGSMELSSGVLVRIARHNINIIIDLYPPS